MNLNAFSLSGIITALSCSIQAIVLLVNAKEKKHVLFALLNTGIAIWGFFLFLIGKTSDPHLSLFYWKLAHIGGALISVFFIHFVYVYRNKKNPLLIFLSYIYGLAFLGLLFSGEAHVGVRPAFERFYYLYPQDYRYPYISGIWLLLAVGGFIELFKSYKLSIGYEKVRNIFLFYSLLIGYTGGSGHFLPIYNIDVYPYGNFLIPIYSAVSTYAILKHHLLDFNLVIRKGLIYSILVTVISLAYFIFAFLLENIFRGFMGYRSAPLTIFIISLFIIIFQPLKNKIQCLVDKYFFKGSIAQIEQENIKLREELQRSEKLKAVGTLAAGMAHEIKNPLTSIKTFTEYLPKKFQQKEFIDKFQRIVGQEVNKINDIVGQLLDFAKPKPLEIKESNIQSLMDETLDLLSSNFIKHGIKIVRNYTGPFVLKIDRVRIKQAFLNIILNAIDAMKEKGGKLTITIKESRPNSTEISIEDTGCGINKKDLRRLFNPFFTTKETNTGLGLSIVHSIIEKHKGKITVKSEPGKGTIFTLSLAAFDK